MIKQLNATPPFITFGFGLLQHTAAVGETVTIWLSTLYGDSYSTALNATSGIVTRVSDYEYEVTYAAAGEYQINLVAGSRKKISLQSNTLTLTVI